MANLAFTNWADPKHEDIDMGSNFSSSWWQITVCIMTLKLSAKPKLQDLSAGYGGLVNYTLQKDPPNDSIVQLSEKPIERIFTLKTNR